MTVEQYLYKVQKEWDWLNSVESWNNYDTVISAYNDLWYIVKQGVNVLKQLQSENVHLLAINAELEERIGEIETQEYGWKFDELKSDYNSVLEQLENTEIEIKELREEIAYLQLKEHNLNIQEEIKNGNC